MNKVLKYILPFIFSICLGLNTYAQEDWEDQGEIENAQIVVEKNKKIELPKANRKFEKIDKLEDKEINTSQKFDDLKPSILGLINTLSQTENSAKLASAELSTRFETPHTFSRDRKI